jgi:hypothetical protein
MIRISTFCAALAVFALSANGANAIHIGPQPRVNIHPKPQHKLQVHAVSFRLNPVFDNSGGGSIKGKRRH